MLKLPNLSLKAELTKSLCGLNFRIRSPFLPFWQVKLQVGGDLSNLRPLCANNILCLVYAYETRANNENYLDQCLEVN